MSHLFPTYKKGQRITFQVTPICEDILDEDGKKIRRDCIPHSHTQTKLAEMLNAIAAAIKPHGFEVEIFGSPESLFKSLHKQFGIGTIIIKDKSEEEYNNAIQTVLKKAKPNNITQDGKSA